MRRFSWLFINFSASIIQLMRSKKNMHTFFWFEPSFIVFTKLCQVSQKIFVIKRVQVNGTYERKIIERMGRMSKQIYFFSCHLISIISCVYMCVSVKSLSSQIVSISMYSQGSWNGTWWLILNRALILLIKPTSQTITRKLDLHRISCDSTENLMNTVCIKRYTWWEEKDTTGQREQVYIVFIHHILIFACFVVVVVLV